MMAQKTVFPHILLLSGDAGEAVFLFRNYRLRGVCAVSLGVGILLALVLPVGVIIFCAGITLIILGFTWMKRC